MRLTRVERERFEANPSRFLEDAIKGYTASSPANRLPAFSDDPIFDEPLLGFADGDDPIFQDYKKVIGEFHFTPREALAMGRQGKGIKGEKRPPRVSVISWILPITNETRLSVRRESDFTSVRWTHTRCLGHVFIAELSNYVVALLEALGHRAVAPEMEDFFAVEELPNGLASNWSQRHIAYAAGLGTFSLNDGFITSRGIAMRCGSAVSDIALPPTPRLYENHLANCLFYRNGSCRRCIERCPVNAITEQGHDKKKCLQFIETDMEEELKRLGRNEGYMWTHSSCGLCQTDVPCEAGIPPDD